MDVVGFSVGEIGVRGCAIPGRCTAGVGITDAVWKGMLAAVRALHDPLRMDRYVQRRLHKAGLFAQPKIIGGQEIHQSLFGFKDRPWSKYLEIADVLLLGEQNLNEKGLLSPEEAERLRIILAAREVYQVSSAGQPRRRVEDRKNEYVHFVQHIRQVLLRNPYAILSEDVTGRVVGITFASFGHADAGSDLPPTMIRQTHWHYRSALGERNAMVDFWFTGETGDIAVATLLSSMELAHAINTLNIPGFRIEKDHVFAYSNLRTLWKWPSLTAEELLELIKQRKAKDPAIGGHMSRGAVVEEVKHNAFPSIFHILGAGIGRRDAVMMRYPFDPGPDPKPLHQDRRKSPRMPSAAALLIAA